MAEDFARRSTAAELMDGPADYDTFRACLRDLATVNVVTLAHGPTLAFLDGLRLQDRLPRGRPTRILDVGSGYGDLLRAIDRWARKRGVAVQLTGVDLNPWSALAAAEATAPEHQIAWATHDVFEHDEPCDVVVSSLFTHHLADPELVRFLAWMEARAEIAWFVNDLHRHPLPHAGFRLLSTLARWHPFVRHDGPVSIARAFTRRDWQGFLAEAGLAPGVVDVRWRFPFRICLARVKP